jgi:ribosomal protein S1
MIYTSIGQEHEGSLISAKNFGVFVGIENGVNVLLPRSLLSKGSYDKLKKMAEAKSEEKIKLELVGVSAENKTLSGKYLPPGLKSRADISVLQG